MTLERYKTLDKAKHTQQKQHTQSWPQSRDWTVVVPIGDNILDLFQPNLVLINKLPYSTQYQIWLESVQCKPHWYMPTDECTAMMKAVEFFAVCANMPKHAVQKQSHGSWIHAIWLHLFSSFSLLSSPWDTLPDLTDFNKQWLPDTVTFVLRFVVWHMLHSTETFVTGSCSECHNNSFRASVVYRYTNQDRRWFMLIQLAML